MSARLTSCLQVGTPRLGPPVRRLAAALLVVILLWLNPGMPCSPSYAAAAPSGARLPLVLIAEPGRDSAGLPKEFIAACEREGYVAGESLFETTPGVFSDLREGAEQIAEFVSACVDRAGGGRVDIIACGVSGLVARLAVDAGLMPGSTVRNLAMVASPNRGTFLACLLKSIVEIAKHESLFEKDNRSWRFLPTGDDILSLFSGSDGDDGLTYSRLTGPDDIEWSDETAWVVERVRDVYEPLYARYVETRFSAIPYIPAESPKETFAGWISRTMPQFWESAVMKSSRPPDGSPAYPLGQALSSASAPPEGKDLSAAYYEVLAMEVAKNQYVMRLASKGSVVETLLKEPYVPTGWKDALVHYGVRVLQYYAKKALHTVKAEVQKVLIDRVVRKTGFIEDSSSPLLRRLIKEDLVVNLGTSISKRFERVPANTYLAALNSTSSERSPSRTTRYISVAAKLASPWSLIWPQLGPNDFFLEVDSAIAPPGPRDVYKVFSGLFSPSGEGLLESKDVQAYLFSLLRDGSRDAQGSLLPVATAAPAGKVTVSSWGPAYIETGGGATSLSVTFPDPPSGWQYQAWTEAAGSLLSQCTSSRFIATAGTYTVDASLGRVGLRLSRTGLLNPIQGRSVSSVYAVETRVDAVIGASSAGSAAGAATGGSAPPKEPDSGAGEDPALSAYPLVRVINRSKRTTHKEPKETYHGSWVIDYGDGDVGQLNGYPELTLSHVFPREGSYRVRVESYDNRGDLLLEKTWNIAVTDGDSLEKEFSCRSIPRLDAELRLTGPAMWVTGKPAVFSAELNLGAGSGVEVVSVDYDPGPKFCVLWERSGDFQVSCAATVRLRYSVEGEIVTVQNTYLAETTVSVLTTGVTR